MLRDTSEQNVHTHSHTDLSQVGRYSHTCTEYMLVVKTQLVPIRLPHSVMLTVKKCSVNVVANKRLLTGERRLTETGLTKVMMDNHK